MSGGQVMVVLIVLIVMIASIVKARMGPSNEGQHGRHEGSRVDSAENRRLHEEVNTLKERLAVLERITIEKENSLEREIEQLRDR